MGGSVQTPEVTFAFPPELLEAIAARAAELVAERLEPAEDDRWMGVEQLARYLDCPRSRIYALTSCKPARIPHERDGSRLIFRKTAIDAWVRTGGARRP